jgi:segregation and condensation protein B
MFDIPQLKRIIEAALLASAQPLSLPQISGLFDELDMPPQEELAKAVEELGADCAERGIELVEVASGFRYQVRQDVHAHVARLWAERPARYSRALLETLALIAYRQPITRAEIEQIRGVAVSTNIIRTLEERDWVRVVGYRDLPGKPALFGTTKQFLDYFSLKSLDELPPLSEIRDIDELDPQLALDAEDAAIAARIQAAAGDVEAGAGNADADAEAENAGDAEPGSEAAAEETTASAAADTAAAEALEDADAEALAQAAARYEPESESADAADTATPSPSSTAAGEEPSGTEEEDTPESTA